MTNLSHVDPDNISINTAVTDNCSHNARDKIREYVVKFLFHPTDNKNNIFVAKTHYTILRAIFQIYSDSHLKIFDNFGCSIDSFPTLRSYDAYLRHYRLHYINGNPSKNRKPLYMVVHCLHSPVPLSEICCNEVIANLLCKVNTRLMLHPWKEDEIKISNLEFHIGMDPTNYLKEFFEERICNQISQVTKCPKTKIPKFQCCYCSPFITEAFGTRITTKTYDLQCCQQDAKTLITLL